MPQSNRPSTIPRSPKPVELLTPFPDAQGYRARFKGFSGTATKNTTTQLDFLIDSDRYVNGVKILLKNHVWGDTLAFKIVDKSGVGVGLGWYTQAQFDAMGEYVADTFAENWFVDDQRQDQSEAKVEFPALIRAGLYIRLEYVSTGTLNDVDVKCNIRLYIKV